MIPLAIYLVLSAITATFLAIASTDQTALTSPESGYHVEFPVAASPGYFGVVTNWDGQWYASIATRGYPKALPMVDGRVLENEWAFYPGYPLLVSAAMRLTGLAFPHAAWLVSVLCGAASAICAFQLVKPRMGSFGAGALVSCLFAFVTAATFQVAYSESLALLLIVLALMALSRRRYTATLLFGLGLAMTRPIVLPLAVVVAAHFVARWRADRRGDDVFSARERRKVLLTAGAMAGSVALWPVLASWITGVPDAYVRTQSAWRVDSAPGLIGGWPYQIMNGTPLGLSALGGLIILILMGLRGPGSAWGSELRAWTVAYTLFLLIATRPSSSILRYFMLAIAPLWPLAGPVPVHQRYYRHIRAIAVVALVAVGLRLQYEWVNSTFVIDNLADQQTFP